MNQIEDYYNKYFYPLYGEERDYKNDKLLMEQNNNLENIYSISGQDRIDLTYLDVYSIDPDGCEDVDDAFSFYESNNTKYIAIHIADPTEYICVDSILFQDIVNKAFTKYPSNKKPIHLMPKEILEKSSLSTSSYCDTKNAISLIIKFDDNYNIQYENIQLYFSKINVKKHHKLSYEEASKLNNTDLNNALQLSKYIFPNMIYNNETKLTIVYKDNRPFFRICNDKELEYKKMIAKFAILSNNYIAYILRKHLDENHIIFRNCPVLNNSNNDINDYDFKDFMNYIIENKVRAQYDNKCFNHDLLNLSEYLHMTSPLRRSVDCVVHYLLKSLFLNKVNPFNQEKLRNIIKHANVNNKKFKKIQFNDNKFRFISCMHISIPNHNFFNIEFYISSIYKNFVNIIIYKMNGFNIYISYTLKYDEINDILHENLKKNFDIDLYTVNWGNKFDRGTFPELDRFIDIYAIV